MGAHESSLILEGVKVFKVEKTQQESHVFEISMNLIMLIFSY
uniref:Uncharacterized protein n=1 Tax=Myoviridae sp. ctIty1 TaxID=2827673 RepID=A0A8S5THX8_9CAUD|nr:MAG TPA: hypothetical protein [Myoviridae sp. ctIty1]DAT42720.1 MAG TPA: hypothetical protein [Caudoviricetes sp.]